MDEVGCNVSTDTLNGKHTWDLNCYSETSVSYYVATRMIVLFLFCFEFRQKGLPQGAHKVAPKKFPISDPIHLPKGGLRRVVRHSDS